LFAENIGDQIDYAQRKNENVGDLVHETLELLEQKGAFRIVHCLEFMTPTYSFIQVVKTPSLISNI
jgi:hypothetical protein